MFKPSVLATVVVAFAVAVAAEKARFDNYRVYTVQIDTVDQLQVLKDIEYNGDGYQFWEYPTTVGGQVKMMVPPHKFSDFGELTTNLQMHSELFIADVQKKIDAVQPQSLDRATFGWTGYHRLSVIYAWLDDVLAANPTILSPIVSGESHLGHPVRGVKLSHKAGNPGVFIEANIHAREWITSATTTWILNELLTSTNPEVQEIAQNYDWYIFPVTNPDGYEFTHTDNRNWRKTRFRFNALCTGADPNRNWAYNWMQGGASSNACSDTYAGPNAFSEVEARSLSEYFATLKGITTYISFHAYGQMLLVPYGHTKDHLDNYDDTVAIGRKALDKLATRYGTAYTLGNIAETIYVATGGSIDWIKGEKKVPLTYCYELRDLGKNGFLLPADQIIPTAQETLDSVVVMLREGKAMGYH